jgi:hypothetical protein
MAEARRIKRESLMNATQHLGSEVEMIRCARELGEGESLVQLQAAYIRFQEGGCVNDLETMVKSEGATSGKAEPGDTATGHSRSPEAWCAVTAQHRPRAKWTHVGGDGRPAMC